MEEQKVWNSVGKSILDGALGYVGGEVVQALFTSFAHIQSSEQRMLNSIRAMFEELKAFIRLEVRRAIQEHEFREMARDLDLARDALQRYIIDPDLYKGELQKSDDLSNRTIKMAEQVGASSLGIYNLAVSYRIASLTILLDKTKEKAAFIDYFALNLRQCARTLNDWDTSIYDSLDPEVRVSQVQVLDEVWRPVPGDGEDVHPLFGFKVDGHDHPFTAVGYKAAFEAVSQKREELYVEMAQIQTKYLEETQMYVDTYQRWMELADNLEAMKGRIALPT